MELLPAIDLLAGKSVRLQQGRYDRKLVAEDDALTAAERFRAAGATWVHVVDLDGARTGQIANVVDLQRIAATGLAVEFGGGVRDEAAIDSALGAGARRVIVGTRALEDFDWFRTVVHDPRYRGKLALGLDARLGRLTVHGRLRESQRSALEVLEAVDGWPLAAIVYTDVARDGLLLGPNIDVIRSLAGRCSVPLFAAGGVTDMDDLRRLAALPLAGVVVGRALHENVIDLAAAQRVLRGG